MARWVSDNPNPRPPVVAETLIAGWWPTTFHKVNTFEYLGATGNDPMLKLIRSIPGANPKDRYIVHVHKCDRYCVAETLDPFYERECETLEEALEAHREVVRLLAAGRLRLKRIRVLR